MIRLYIILMALIVKAAFSKVEGTFFPIDFFLFSDLKMIWPEYAWHITFYFAFAILAWELFLQETRFKREMRIFALLMTGEFLDFIFRCNEIYFHWGNYPFGYDAVMLIIFGLTTIISTWQHLQLES